jgi:ATP-dependent RNA helicase MSS116
LTQAESYFLRVNPQLPIKPHPELDTIQATVPELASEVDEAMDRVDPAVKARAYSSYIGFFAGSGRLKKLQLDKAGLVQLANEMAIKGFNCPEQPEISKKIVDKMGLKGVPGFIFSNDSAAKPRHPRRKF